MARVARVAASMALLLAAQTSSAVRVSVKNQCAQAINLYDNTSGEPMASGAELTRDLAAGFNGMFRDGSSSQATRKFVCASPPLRFRGVH